MFELNVKTID